MEDEEEVEDGNQETRGQDEDWSLETGCKVDKNEEVYKYRSHQYQENPGMQITGEDIEIVIDCDHCGPGLTDMLRQDCEEDDCCGRGWVREDYTLCIIGNDVVSLFPSLDSLDTGKIVREEVARSTMSMDGFNMKLGVKYIVMNKEYTSNKQRTPASENDQARGAAHHEEQVGQPQGDPSR